MKQTFRKIWNLYAEGFRSMTWGRILWTIILIKLFVMFFILRPFFFPRYLNEHPSQAPAQEIVAGELIDRIVSE
ncbi:MAG: DUF4492 domain-containing protein [Bacteroides sp.]